VDCFCQSEQLLYIHPDQCIDCEACVPECPVEAIFYEDTSLSSGKNMWQMEIAGVTLVKGDLRAIARARRLSRATMGNIRQNLFLVFVYNLASVPVAAGVLHPFLGILINPIWAGAAMSLSSLSVVGNALRLRQAKL